jgi:hypothetical protein
MKARTIIAAYSIFLCAGSYSAAGPQESSHELAASPTPVVRLSWQEFAKDPANVDDLRKAVATMKARNSAPVESKEFRTSWSYWANIHGYYGPGSPFGTVAQAKQIAGPANSSYFSGITDVSPPDQLARDIWAQCQHGTQWFFAWHRLYLYYFEKELQAASGNPNLRLPYWDYTNPAELAMPTEFTQATYIDSTGQKHSNPLFEPRRAPAWGTPGTTLDGDATDVDDPLKNKSDFTDFQEAIENNVHGYLHCTVSVNCPVPDMGAVPYSSNDPIFWLHHANIDRLWSCWANLPGHKNPSDSTFTHQPYSFVDENGNKVTSSVDDLFNGKLKAVLYQEETNCARAMAAVSSAGNGPMTSELAFKALPEARVRAFLDRPQVLNSAIQPLLLTGTKTSVKIRFPRTSSPTHAVDFALFSHPAVTTQTRLILKNISFKSHPGAMFNVFVVSSKNAAKRVRVGTLALFGIAPNGATEGEGSSSNSGVTKQGESTHTHPASGLTRDFNVTDAIRQLGPDARQGVTVMFEATNGRLGDSSPVAIDSKAKLTIGGIEFQVRLSE